MKNNIIRQRLLEEMQTIRTVDCHSHTYSPKVYYENGPYDLFTLMQYFTREIQALTGKTSNELFKKNLSGTDRWKSLKAILGRARNVSYWRHQLVVYKHLFDFQDSELTDHNWHALNKRIKEYTADPEWYDHVTKDVCNLETQVKNIEPAPRKYFFGFQDWEPEYFTAVLRMEPALALCNQNTRISLENYLGEGMNDLDAVKDGLRKVVKDYHKKGAVGIKLGHAYERTLASERVSYETASTVYKKAFKGKKITALEIKAFQDYIIYYLAELVGQMDLVFQIHTGVQTLWGNIPDSNPLLLIPLIQSHPSTRFDLFHAGYPYSREIGMLGKHYPNVWLNMAWMYIITMEGSRQCLSEWIDLVPGSRILGFGSDVIFPELIYGHLLMARSCIADVLSEKVKRDFISEEIAMDLLNKLFRENAIELYSLQSVNKRT